MGRVRGKARKNSIGRKQREDKEAWEQKPKNSKGPGRPTCWRTVLNTVYIKKDAFVIDGKDLQFRESNSVIQSRC